MASQARDRAWWDEAIEKLVMSPDDLFADDNIGSYLFEDFEISIAAVIHPDGSRGFTFLNGENRTDDKIPDMFAGLFRELHDEANTAGMAEPEAHARYVRVEDRTLVLAAAAMTHENQRWNNCNPGSGQHCFSGGHYPEHFRSRLRSIICSRMVRQLQKFPLRRAANSLLPCRSLVTPEKPLAM